MAAGEIATDMVVEAALVDGVDGRCGRRNWSEARPKTSLNLCCPLPAREVCLTWPIVPRGTCSAGGSPLAYFPQGSLGSHHFNRMIGCDEVADTTAIKPNNKSLNIG